MGVVTQPFGRGHGSSNVCSLYTRDICTPWAPPLWLLLRAAGAGSGGLRDLGRKLEALEAKVALTGSRWEAQSRERALDAAADDAALRVGEMLRSELGSLRRSSGEAFSV